MTYNFFSHNGRLLPIDQAVIPLSRIEYSYGFGVYESVRVAHGAPYFIGEHSRRLLDSAAIITLDHQFSEEFIRQSIEELIAKNEVDSCNIKIMLIGGKDAQAANLYIQCLNPFFPDRKLYREGAHAITAELERPFPHAKSLNMLPSYLAYRQAKSVGAYDALLLNRHGLITEGTRTNFFALSGRTIVSAPASDILLGVTREHVLEVAQQNGFQLSEKAVQPSEISNYDGAFLTSTSSKIMPLRSIDDHAWDSIAPALLDLMSAFDKFLETEVN